MAPSIPTTLTITAKALTDLEAEAPPKIDDRGERAPPGELVADLVATGLAARGWKVAYRWTTFTSHAMDAQRKKDRYDVEVSLVDAERGAYSLSAKPRVGFFQRVFASKVDASELALLRMDIERALADDARVVPGTWAEDGRA